MAPPTAHSPTTTAVTIQYVRIRRRLRPEFSSSDSADGVRPIIRRVIVRRVIVSRVIGTTLYRYGSVPLICVR
ncbi:hypothetical protein GCM10027605_19300 [Micromonospora zhanjiangensis]